MSNLLSTGCLLVLTWVLVGCRPTIAHGDPLTERAQEVPAVVILDAPQPQRRLTIRWARGSAHDLPGQEGLVALAAQSLAGEGLNVEVQAEATWFEVSCPDDPGRCESAAARVLGARPTDDDVAGAHRALLDRHGPARGAHPSDLAARIARTVVYFAHPYGNPAEGRWGVLDLLGRTQVLALLETTRVRSTVRLGLAGPFEPDQIDRIQAQLGALEPRLVAAVPLQRAVAPEGTTLVLVTDPAVAGVGVALARSWDHDPRSAPTHLWPGPPAGCRQAHPQDALADRPLGQVLACEGLSDRRALDELVRGLDQAPSAPLEGPADLLRRALAPGHPEAIVQQAPIANPWVVVVVGADLSSWTEETASSTVPVDSPAGPRQDAPSPFTRVQRLEAELRRGVFR